ncbi:MAG: homoserine O-succinyltransferase [Lysobacteraceae bacterium]|nr:homoserine O-succinyltransferase [Xanthomonadales bacterium]HPF74296.1 homoserine O-succinyltransferase [Xanthomonadaceae bacterium]HRY00635.1 homoserine O-succinyltransferase [Xanthomonadaceae bacterium]
MSLTAASQTAETSPCPVDGFDAAELSSAVDTQRAFRRGQLRCRLPLRHAGERSVWVRYEVQGAAGAPWLVVQGGISANRHVASCAEAAEPGWWQAQCGDDRAIDTRRFRVLSIDWLGSDGALDVPLDCADQADAIAAVLDALDVDRVRAYVGCSYGASVGLHFAARHASRLDQLIAIAGAHRPEAWALAQRKIQRGIVELGCNEQARVEALSLARQLAMIGYRTREELAERFPQGPRLDNKGLQHDCADWLNHVGAQYAARTPVTAWLRLSESLDLHRVDPAAISTPTTVMAVDEDQLVPPSLIDELVNGLPLPCRLHRLHSRYGHDAFLKETTAFDALLRSELEVAA